MKKNNPFTLTFGRQPNEYINRYENIESIVSAFDGDFPASQVYLIEGIRGCGKTVLMTAIEKTLAETGRWITVDLNQTNDLLEDFAKRILGDQKKVSSAIDSGFSLSVAGVGIGVNPKVSKSEIAIIEAFLLAAKKKKKKVLITIDEVNHDNNMKRFASEFQLLIRKDLPVFLLMTGLYENVYEIQNDPALTFLLRTPKLSLKPLSIAQIAKQYKKVFDIDEVLAKQLAVITKGYAFAFQALGLLYFEYRSELTLDEIVSKLDDMLDDFVYRKIWESLSDMDRRIIGLIGETPVKVSYICNTLNISATSFSRYKERLIKRGVVENTQHGFISLTLPRFSNIISYYL